MFAFRIAEDCVEVIIVGDQDGNSLGCGEADRREVKYRGPSYTERVYSEIRDSQSYDHFEELR